jgi:hypothetical protein
MHAVYMLLLLITCIYLQVFQRTYAVLLLISVVMVQHKCNKFAEGMLPPALLLLAVVVQQTHCYC